MSWTVWPALKIDSGAGSHPQEIEVSALFDGNHILPYFVPSSQNVKVYFQEKNAFLLDALVNYDHTTKYPAQFTIFTRNKMKVMIPQGIPPGFFYIVRVDIDNPGSTVDQKILFALDFFQII